MRPSWIVVACVLFPVVVRADVAKGDAAFEEAKRLESEGKLTEACAKFHESLTYNPHAIGTLLNVAVCEEKLGKIASALSHFTEARDRAREGNLEQHRKVAEEHIATLTPDVPHVTITLTEVLPETKLLVDDHAVLIEDASNLAVDPGIRTIVVTAPDRVPYETKVSIDKGERKSVTIPKLAPPVKNIRRIISIGVAAAGVVTLGTGIALGYHARGNYRDQFLGSPPNCADVTTADGTMKLCNDTGLSNTHAAQRLGTIATWTGVVGIAAIVAGGVLWFTAPKLAERNVAVIPTVSPDSAGVAAVGSF
jgi:hypothetical protein